MAPVTTSIINFGGSSRPSETRLKIKSHTTEQAQAMGKTLGLLNWECVLDWTSQVSNQIWKKLLKYEQKDQIHGLRTEELLQRLARHGKTLENSDPQRGSLVENQL